MIPTFAQTKVTNKTIGQTEFKYLLWRTIEKRLDIIKWRLVVRIWNSIFSNNDSNITFGVCKLNLCYITKWPGQEYDTKIPFNKASSTSFGHFIVVKIFPANVFTYVYLKITHKTSSLLILPLFTYVSFSLEYVIVVFLFASFEFGDNSFIGRKVFRLKDFF